MIREKATCLFPDQFQTMWFSCILRVTFLTYRFLAAIDPLFTRCKLILAIATQ